MIKRIGKKKLIVNRDEVEIASHGPWKVVECTAYSKNGWKSIKVYLNRPARKNVWRLGFKGSHSSRSHDAGIFTAYHPDVFEWVRCIVAGIEAVFPEDDSAKKDGIFPVPDNARQVILRLVEQWQDEAAPLSNKTQTRKTERYIIPKIMKSLGTTSERAKLLTEGMIRGREIEVFMVSKKTRIKGLRVVKKMEIEMDNG
jgi:hypothetical protein